MDGQIRVATILIASGVEQNRNGTYCVDERSRTALAAVPEGLRVFDFPENHYG
jgi:hypothetical protein